MRRARFVSLWSRCLQDEQPCNAEAVYLELDRLYGQPSRFYHNLKHIDACLNHLDMVHGQISNVDAVELALWFHDAIYDPLSKQNERRSADLFLRFARVRFDAGFARQVHDLIMMTLHPSNPQRADERFIVDIDLSSFGLPWDKFIHLGELIRKEYAHLTDETFDVEQLRFFEALAQRPNFFSTDYFRERYEDTAKSNLLRKIAHLKARTGRS